MVSILPPGVGGSSTIQRTTTDKPRAATSAAAAAAPLPDAGTAAAARLDDAKKAVATMTGIAQSMRQARSGQAKQRLQQLLAQVKMLRMMGGDPKAVAKEAARLAKEIGSAAKDYTAGADSGVTVSTPTTATAPAATPASTDPQLSSDVTQALADAHKAEQQATPSTSSAPAPANADPAAATQSRQDEIDRLTAPGAASQARAKAIEEDQRLFAEVKAAVSHLHAMIERAAHEAKRTHDVHGAGQAADQAKEAEKAAKDVDDAIKTIGSHDEGGTSASSTPASLPVASFVV